MATAFTPISELPVSAPLSSLAQATQGQIAQSSPSVPQQETLPDLPRIPVFDQDAQTERFLQSPIVSQQSQKQLPPTEVLPAVRPMPKIDFGMKLIAGIAAAKGNFGPAFEIKQMERKSAAYTEYLDGRRQFNYLMSRGDDKRAEELLRESSARVLSIAPELKEMVIADTERLYKKQETAAQVQGIMALAKEKQRGGADNQGFIDILKASGPFAHSPEALQRFLTLAGYTFAPNPSQNQTIRHDPMGDTKVIQLPYSFSEQNLKGPVGDSIVAALGFQPNEIANAVNKQPVMRGDTDVGPALKQIVTPILAMARGVESQIELVKNVPHTPEQNLSYMRSLEGKGFDEFERNLLASARGAVPKEFLRLLKTARGDVAAITGMGITEASQQQLIADRRRALKDAIDIQGDVPMVMADKLQNLVIVPKTGSRQWTAHRGQMTFNQAAADPENYAVLSEKLHESKVIPMTIAMQDLKYVKEMFAYAGHPKDAAGRFSSGAQQLITRYMGSSDPRDAKLQVTRVLAERAIETVSGTANIPDAEVGRLKGILTGILAGETGGVAGTEMLIKRLTDTINVYIGDNSESVTRDIGKPTASTPTPTVATLNKAAGVTAKGKEKQAPDATMLKVRSSIVNVIEGMDDINLPLERSKNYQANSEQIVGNGSVTGKQMVQLMMSAQLSELRKKGVGRDELYKYVIGTDDTKEVVLSKLKAVEGLMGGGKPALAPTTSTTPTTPAPIATPPIGTGPITLNPGVVHIPRKK